MNQFLAFCQMTMAFLSPSVEPPPRELILDTYRKLWTEIGRVDNNLEVAERVIQGKDPFKVPKDGGTERDSLAALEKHLTSFKNMLETHGWNDPEVQAMLVDFLQERSRGMRKQAVALVPILDREGIVPKGYQLSYVKRFIAPDSRFFVSVDDLHTNDIKFSFHDRKTGIETSLVLPYVKNHSPKVMGFTPDGKYLVLADARGPAMRLVPYKDGGLDFNAAVVVSAAPLLLRLASSWDKRMSKPAETISFGKDGLIAMHCPYGGTTLFVFDTKARKGWQLETPFLKEGDSLKNWGFVPGTKRLYFTIIEKVANPQTQRVDFAELNGKQLGTISTMKSLETDNFSMWYGRASVSGDGKYGIMNHKEGLELIDMQKHTSTVVSMTGVLQLQRAFAFFPDPKGNGFGVIVNKPGAEITRTLVWFDPERKTWSEDQDLPMRLHDDFMLTSDGREIITNIGDAAYRSTPFRR